MTKNTKSLKRHLACLLATVLLPLAAHAGEQGHYAPSSWSPRDLISAPAGLMVFAPYVSFYDADKARTGSGATVEASEGIDVGADSWMFTPVLVYAPSVKPLGAGWSITVAPAYGEAGANARFTAYGQDVTLFDNNNTGWSGSYSSSDSRMHAPITCPAADASRASDSTAPGRMRRSEARHRH